MLWMLPILATAMAAAHAVALPDAGLSPWAVAARLAGAEPRVLTGLAIAAAAFATAALAAALADRALPPRRAHQLTALAMLVPVLLPRLDLATLLPALLLAALTLVVAVRLPPTPAVRGGAANDNFPVRDMPGRARPVLVSQTC